MIAPNRKAETLVPIVRAKILPGTRIMSDEWKAYARLKDYGHTHDTDLVFDFTVKENESEEFESEESDSTESDRESDILDENDILQMTEFEESDSLGAGDGANASEFDPMEVD
ncbi:uncharacterized protein MONOS_7226 [Monocercomonoides exilis]|uniref:uncharacterized protein n=1 Tax=Monocercomonoides exilis TaxID=2049356 RepID=UPI003559D9CD|nr:hypothetical protein MONOS_7226 [Monocercomonoides exilis]|eukprot:MONOS_7226.1-p1 / transcript=MONOS_7226.1 / gene=MONOS_7226 / organism=Monocercomonoides_exilis_PA203 / gene_product=unspecified product / transcript_product=unspecified product / location=Mono_scaffold00242:6377-7165(-) / protein_length=112 / sequence_SO=supercontig / SO=protein_coding / is_pseudo=false